MFGIGSMELAVILLVALLVLGPEHLPKAIRTVQKYMSEFRRVSSELQRAINLEEHLKDFEKQNVEAKKTNNSSSSSSSSASTSASTTDNSNIAEHVESAVPEKKVINKNVAPSEESKDFDYASKEDIVTEETKKSTKSTDKKVTKGTDKRVTKGADKKVAKGADKDLSPEKKNKSTTKQTSKKKTTTKSDA